MKFISTSTAVSQTQKAKAQNAVDQLLTTYRPLLEALQGQLHSAHSDFKSLEDIKKRYSQFAIVGIGGSSLGIQVLTQFFSKNNFVFFDNVDAVQFDHQMNSFADLDKVFWLFISKSGETIETLAALEFIDQIYQQKGKNLKAQSLVITENKSNSLSQLASRHQVPQYEIPVNVGGRYSVLSYVGLVPAFLMDLDLKALEAGAKKALQTKELLTSFVAEALASFEREEWITVLWSYSSQLKNFGFWWQQLWAESLAKKTSLDFTPAARVSTPLPLVGATDQHSVLQQVAEGAKDKLIIFLRNDASEGGTLRLKQSHCTPTKALTGLRLGDLLKAESLATQQSLTESGVSNISLQIDKLDEENLGFLLMFMQLSILALGTALNINPLDQPGVERGKVLCKTLLAEISLH